MKKDPLKGPKKILKASKTKKTSTKSPKPKPISSKTRALRPVHLISAVLFSGVILAVVGFGILKINQKSLYAFLPQESTVAVLEWEDAQLPGKANKQTVLPALEQLTGLPVGKLPGEWWDHPFGLLLMEGGAEAEENVWVLFAQGSSRQALKEDLTQIQAFSFDTPLYSHAQGLTFNFGLTPHYLFLSSNPKAIANLEHVLSQKNPVLKGDASFQGAQKKVPRKAWLKGYLQTHKLKLPQFPTAHYTLSALSTVAPQAAFAVEKKSHGVHLSSWLPVSSSSPEARQEEKTRMVKQMAEYFPADSTALFVSGPNLTDQWQATLTDLSRMNPAYGVILESLLRAQVQELFGGNVNLRNDLYPLLEGRYGAILNQTETGYALGMVGEHTDEKFVEVKLDKLLNGFYALIGRLNPQIKVVTLPDGTESRELIASTQRAEKTEESYGEWSLKCLSTEGGNNPTLKAELLRGFCYTVTAERFYFATDQTLLHHMLDASDGKTSSLAKASAFRQGLKVLQGSGEERSYVNLEKLIPLLEKTADKEKSPWPAFLSVLGQSTWIKDVTQEGVKLEGFISLK